ncbi:hypothetical protein LX36DRAFT_319772 [Colletotrichum falcatum]|nr:hypothetical protein LX36DRAFT_319772 [Colletotrichum falcatum]
MPRLRASSRCWSASTFGNTYALYAEDPSSGLRMLSSGDRVATSPGVDNAEGKRSFSSSALTSHSLCGELISGLGPAICGASNRGRSLRGVVNQRIKTRQLKSCLLFWLGLARQPPQVTTMCKCKARASPAFPFYFILFHQFFFSCENVAVFQVNKIHPPSICADIILDFFFWAQGTEARWGNPPPFSLIFSHVIVRGACVPKPKKLSTAQIPTNCAVPRRGMLSALPIPLFASHLRQPEYDRDSQAPLTYRQL